MALPQRSFHGMAGGWLVFAAVLAALTCIAKAEDPLGPAAPPAVGGAPPPPVVLPAPAQAPAGAPPAPVGGDPAPAEAPPATGEVSPAPAPAESPAAAPAPAVVALPPELLARLLAEAFVERKAAEMALLEWARNQPPAALDEIFRQSRNASEPEIRVRCFNVLRTLVEEERLRNGEGYLGVQMNVGVEPVAIQGERQPRFAIRLMRVEDDTPAHKAGLTAGDLLLAVNGTTWTQNTVSEDVSRAIRSLKAGTPAVLTLCRDAKAVEIKVELARRPAEAEVMRRAAAFGFFGDAGMLEQLAAAQEEKARESYLRAWIARRKAAAK